MKLGHIPFVENTTYSRLLMKMKIEGGCWFCPNSSVEDFARLAREHPELWAELEKLSHDPEICSQSFKYGRTFESVDREVQAINSRPPKPRLRQMSIYDISDKSVLEEL